MIPIIAPPSVAFATLLDHTPADAAPWFRRALVALWDAGTATGVDPAVLAGQCAHETAWGHFGGAVTPNMGNTCGLKIRNPSGDRPEDHMNFGLDTNGFPMMGARAHADHLRLYAGFPVNLITTYDPRATYIRPGTRAFGSVVYVEDLGQKWAPSPAYGTRVAGIVLMLQGRVTPPVAAYVWTDPAGRQVILDPRDIQVTYR